jgi:hypothetical protein
MPPTPPIGRRLLVSAIALATTFIVVKDCGYNSGRGVSGVDGTSVFAETMPPADAYATRTPPNPKQGTTLETIEGYVTGAQTHGAGWVQLVFHHLCDGCDAYSITPGQLRLAPGLAARPGGEQRGRPNHARGDRRLGATASTTVITQGRRPLSRSDCARCASPCTSQRPHGGSAAPVGCDDRLRLRCRRLP